MPHKRGDATEGAAQNRSDAVGGVTPSHKRAFGSQQNQLVSRERAADEHAFADLQNWRILTKVRMEAWQATTPLRALLALTNAEIGR
jgi:hypothetical protein